MAQMATKPEIANGCLWIWSEATDFLLTWAEVDKLPVLVQQDTKIYEYNQWTTPHCTLYSAFGAVSDLFNYEWTQQEINQMVEESYERGRVRGEWWWVKSAVDLVADYWNENHGDLGKVVYYRIQLYDTETVDKILQKNYTLCSWYRWNAKYNADYKEDGILNWVSFGDATYGHAVSWIGREGKRFIKDNYKGRSTNIYEVEHTPSEMVQWGTYYVDAYLYTKVDNLDEIKRLETLKTECINCITSLWTIWHLTNEQNFQSILHYTADKLRAKVKTCEEMLDELKR